MAYVRTVAPRGGLPTGSDIVRAAKLLIDHHGIGAPIRAAFRADELQDDGDADCDAVWRQIFDDRRVRPREIGSL